jgi:hypothetical protein
MDMISINSSAISKVGYDADTATLVLEFTKGNVYEYYDVPQYEYDGLMSAESAGSYASKNIYKAYRQNKIG